jgi:DNA replication protein
MENPEIKDFIIKEQMTPEQIDKSYANFHEYLNEREKFLNNDASYLSKGYEPRLIMNHGYADIAYKATEDLLRKNKELDQKRRVKLVGLPKSYKDLTWADVSLDNQGRADIYRFVSNFLSNFNKNSKGAYIYGDFGVGKSFIMAAMAKELAIKGISTTIIHYPTFAIDVRNAIKDDKVKDMLDEVKTSQVLVLDDLGAEQSSSWLRDEVLQPILQYRMQEDLPTFVTSNLNMEGLESHLAQTKNANEIWPAKRVMERVRYLTEEIRLEGENKRHE